MRYIEKAFTKAIELHHGQVRKGGSTPYVVHPIEVAFIVAQYIKDEQIIAAALLHDTIEDCGYTRETMEQDFGANVALRVSMLSEDKSITPIDDRKRNNLVVLRDSLKIDNATYFIKVADSISNMRSLKSLLQECGTAAWQQFNASREGKMEYCRAILHDTRHFLPAELVEDYVNLLKDLEYSDSWAAPAIGFATPVQQ